MPDLSVLIPSRKEQWLAQTVASIRAAIRGDTEIIVVVDGEEDGPPIADCGEPPVVRVLRNAAPQGQRQAINQAARASSAKFLLKTDAHSLLAEGFDTVLMADCEYDWTVIPRMYNLHSHDMVCLHCGNRVYNAPVLSQCPRCRSEKIGRRPAIERELVWQINKRKGPTDWMWFRAPDCSDMPLRVQYWDGPTGREFPAETKMHKEWARRQGDIADVMTGQGACWFLHRQRYRDLGGLDEGHGGWGQMGVEVALKAWLSGGRQVVNRKTWFAHLFRCGGSESCPWEMSGREQEAARRYSIDLWTGGKWEKQVRSLDWLIEKFWPVPTWKKPETVPELRDFPPQVPEHEASLSTPSVRSMGSPDLTVLYYTDCFLPNDFAGAVRDQLPTAAASCPIVMVYADRNDGIIDTWKDPSGSQITRISMNEDLPRNHESVYRQILAGLEQVQTPYVALAEHDVLYPAGYFEHRPTAPIEYNTHRWILHADLGVFSRRGGPALSQCFARTDALRAGIARCLEELKAGSQSRPDRAEPEGATFKTAIPTIDVSGHGYNLTGPKSPRGKTRTRVKPWGTYADVVAQFEIPSDVPVYNCPACGHNFRAWDARVIGVHISRKDDGEEYNKYGCPACGMKESKWVKVADWETSHHRPWQRRKESADIAEKADTRLPTTNDQPKVSILIPARNEEYLAATVQDLLTKLRLPAEILVGLDGPAQRKFLPESPDARVRVIEANPAIGMRPMINRLAREARGEYLIRLDAHCMIDDGMDAKLVEVLEKEGHATVVAMRYELDARRWQRRDTTDVPYRRLSHASEDGKGLRSLAWPEYAAGRADKIVDETMSCSGSSWTCRRETFVEQWGGFDEQHGTFGQEGCEIACMTWLSGGRFLVHKGTWYAHHNRGKAPYAMGPHTKDQSIARSHELWPGNHWKHARYGFEWLLEKFHPPGWEKEISNFESQIAKGIPAAEQRALVKSRKRLRVDDLWNARTAISDPGKRHRLTIFWKSYEEFVRSVLAGQPLLDGQYYHYLLGHVSRDPAHQPTLRERAKADKSLMGSVALIKDIQAHGLTAPLEFYVEDGKMILWKGYRRLVIAHVLGISHIVGRTFADRQAAGALSPQMNLTRLQNPAVTDLHDLAADQFNRWTHQATDKYFTHAYTRYYDVHLQPIRKRAKKVLELGLLNGASLALWRDYFPRAQLFGVDIDPDRWKKFAADLDRCEVLVGDETDAAFLKRVAAQGPYDLIVDDASHDPLLQRSAFEALWPAVRQYGYYVIEDTFRGYDGQENGKPPGLPTGFETRIYRERDVLAIHHYYNISFVQKA